MRLRSNYTARKDDIGNYNPNLGGAIKPAICNASITLILEIEIIQTRELERLHFILLHLDLLSPF